MTHPNRIITINLTGDWRLYTSDLPASGRPIGTITYKDDVGALVLVENSQNYIQVNNGVARSLPQQKVRAILSEIRVGQGGPGRGQGRKIDEEIGRMVRVNISIDEGTQAILKKLGDGQLSKGIRLAADFVVTHKYVD